MKLSQITEAQYYRGNMDANKAANLYWDAYESDSLPKNLTFPGPPRLYETDEARLEAYVAGLGQDKAVKFIKGYLKHNNLPYTSIHVGPDTGGSVVMISYKET